MAIKLSAPKNRITEDALRAYLDQLIRDEYEQSFKMASEDVEMIKMAEEGLVDFGHCITKCVNKKYRGFSYVIAGPFFQILQGTDLGQYPNL